MKNTMNSRDIAKFHRLIKAGEKPDVISEILRVSIKTLKKFTPEIMDAAKAKAKAIAGDKTSAAPTAPLTSSTPTASTPQKGKISGH